MRIAVDPNDFFDELVKDNLSKGKEYKVDAPLLLAGKNFTWQVKSICNVIFNELVTFSNIDIKFGIHFVNCQFKKGIHFINVTNTTENSSSLNLDDNEGGIILSNCESDGDIFVHGCKVQRGILIQSDSVLKTITIVKSKIGYAGLKIKNCTISSIDIDNCLLELDLKNSTIGSLLVESNKGNISLVKSKFGNWAKFWNIECTESITLNDNIFEDSFSIEGSRINKFNIHGDVFHRMGNLENRDISDNAYESWLNEIYITDASFIEGFEFDGMGEKLNKVTLPITTSSKGILKIRNWKIEETRLQGINQNLNLIFDNNSFRRIIFNDFSNLGSVRFNRGQAYNENSRINEDKNSSLIIYNTSFGDTKFYEFDFKSFDFINAGNASFEGIEASNVIWFLDDNLQINSSSPSDELGFRKKRELYRQIKQALKSKGNQIDSLEFQAREMRAYRDELRASKKYSVGDKVIMIVQQTNNYGLSWLRALKLIIIITFITYSFCLPFFSVKIHYDIDSEFISCKVLLYEFIDNLPTFIQMLNPARSFSSTYGDSTSTILYFIDLLHRVLLGILIFQLITSFRRLSNK
ncbi:hypothetical protein [Myroides sp. WP-1]|uniref:hypothetical protein n=1 Tax=Myroides sp. WP-1 TaxID=2759944 RepID=UPI0015FAEA68|nr:hypothetical protein [Myroides sp. WP-1]MBB1140157.1 hypothetical protein [Myroides sp. WP-1]